LDPQTGLHRYHDPVAAAQIDQPIYVVKVGDRWLFSRDTLAGVPDMGPPLSGTLRRILPDWSRKTFIGVELWSYGGIVLLIFVALLFQKLMVFIIGTYLRRLLGTNKFVYLGTALRRADRPIGGLVMALVFYIGFPMLLFPVRASELALISTQALAAYSGVWLAYRLIDVLSDFMAAKAEKTDTKLDDQLVPLVTKTLKVFVAVVGGIFILQNMSVDVGSLLTGLGLGGLAFALAARDTVANFFGSVMIFLDKPFQIGDWIVMSGTEGVIEEVGFRTSRVRTFYNSVVTVPNGMVVNQIVDNYGRRQYRRYTATLGLTYGTPPEKVEAFCEGVRAIIAGMPGMRKDYYLVEFKDFGASALEIMLYCFMVAPSWNDELRTRSRLNLEIMKLAQELGVSFAYPTQTLHIETLPNPGEARPQHKGSSDRERLTGVVDQFHAPRRPADVSRGYYCDSKKVQAGDGEGEG
ncbi:MAG TPA: mechanosensitive ion channel family protein, partial [Kofleriaceae bacterium]|nr:mechanosensitive ion channel family protein [Kofleriaceae bacterium]